MGSCSRLIVISNFSRSRSRKVKTTPQVVKENNPTRSKEVKKLVKHECPIKHCVNNLEGYCQSRLRNWFGRCNFKRRPQTINKDLEES